MEWTKGKLYLTYKNRYSFMHIEIEEQKDIFEVSTPKAGTIMKAIGDKLVVKDDKKAFFYTYIGKSLGEESFTWNNSPKVIIYNKPYLISFEDDQIEIHNVDRKKFVQVIRNNHEIEQLVDGPLLLGITKDSIYAFLQRPLDRQVRDKKQYIKKFAPALF